MPPQSPSPGKRHELHAATSSAVPARRPAAPKAEGVPTPRADQVAASRVDGGPSPNRAGGADQTHWSQPPALQPSESDPLPYIGTPASPLGTNPPCMPPNPANTPQPLS